MSWYRCAYAEANVLGSLSSSEATVIFASEPLWAAAFAWATLGETMGVSAMAGGGLIVSACLLSAMAGGGGEGGGEGSEAADALRQAWDGVTARARSVRRGLDSGSPALGMLGLLSPAAVEAIESLADLPPDLSA